MGNTIAKNNSDTINWNNVNTDKFSPTMNNKYLSGDSKLLYDRLTLNLPEIDITESEQDIDKTIFAKYTSALQAPNTNELSDTSPFISSEMYNYLMNQDGGAKKRSGKRHKKQRGGNVDKDDSSTSSTSSSSSSSSDKKKDKKKNKEESDSDLEQDNMSEDLSYVSSSAHTEQQSSDEQQSGGYENTSVSNDNSDLPPSSINTSDINMVSESS
jgi:hypothetical protein